MFTHSMTLYHRLRACHLITGSKAVGLIEYELLPPKQRAKIGPFIVTLIDSLKGVAIVLESLETQPAFEKLVSP